MKGLAKKIIYFTENMRSFFDMKLNGTQFECKSIRRNKFPDGTPDIFIEGLDELYYDSHLHKRDVIYFTQYEDLEGKKMEEIIIHVLADTPGIDTLTIVDLFDPLATMERVTKEGQVATANVDAHFWKTLPLPDSGAKIRRVLFDHHTLHNRFYYSGGNTRIYFYSAVPLLLDSSFEHTVIAYPDEGAYKRFSPYFAGKDFGTVVCGKVRDGDKRIVKISECTLSQSSGADIAKERVVIVDDLVRSGGTLKACATALRQYGFQNVDVFVTHAQFPKQEYKSFEDFADIDTFITTNTIPRVTNVLSKKFVVLDVFPLIKIINF